MINLLEYQFGTNATYWDTDGDTFSDGEKVSAGTDPLDATDYPSVTELKSTFSLFIFSILFTKIAIFHKTRLSRPTKEK